MHDFILTVHNQRELGIGHCLRQNLHLLYIYDMPTIGVIKTLRGKPKQFKITIHL